MIESLQALYEIISLLDWAAFAFAFGMGMWLGDSGSRRVKMGGGMLALAVLFYYAITN